MCQQGTLRSVAAITEVSVIKKILRHLPLAVDPPPLAPARHVAFAWDFSSPSRALRPAVRPLLAFSLSRVSPSPSVCIPSSVWTRPPRCAAAGHALVRLGLLSALLQEHPLERIPLTSVQERLERSSSAPPPAARTAAPAAPVTGFQRAATGSGATK